MDSSCSAVSGATHHDLEPTNDKISKLTDKCESIVEEFVKANEPKYTKETSSEISDVESVATIGEISIDEYFDEIFYGNTSQSTEKQSDKEPSSSKPSTSKSFSSVINDNPEISLNPLEKIVDEQRPTKLIQHTSFADHIRTEAIRAADTSNTHNSDKRRETNKKCFPYTEASFAYKKTRFDNIVLDDVGIKSLPCFLYFYNWDQEIMDTNRYISVLPASRSICDILKEFAVKKKIEKASLSLVLEAFDYYFPMWGFRKIEILQWNDMRKKYPGRPLNEIYGLVHFIRFSSLVPFVLQVNSGPGPNNYTRSMIDFMKKFMNYMEEMQFEMRTDEYDHVMPDYYRMTFNQGPSKFIYDRKKNTHPISF